jgi:hypothetical protein
MGIVFGKYHNFIGEISRYHSKHRVFLTTYVPRMYDPPERQKIIYQGDRYRYDWYFEFFTMYGLFSEVVWL